MVNPNWKPVLPSNPSVLKGQYQPLSSPLFVYVNDKALLDSSEVRNSTKFLIRNAPALVAKTNYIPFPDSTFRLVETKLYRYVLGTSFGGDLPLLPRSWIRFERHRLVMQWHPNKSRSLLSPVADHYRHEPHQPREPVMPG